MDLGVATLVVGVLSLLGQLIVAWMSYHIKHATNGMKAELEKAQYERGRRDQVSDDSTS